YRHLRRVVVQLVMRRELVVPLEFAGVCVERHDAVAVEVVAKPRATIPVRRGIARAEVNEIGRCIISAVVPYSGAAFLPGVASPGVVARLARRRDGVELPHLPAGLHIVGGDEAANAQVTTGG